MFLQYSPYQPYQIELFPTPAHQERFVKSYLTSYNGGIEPSNAEINNFLHQVQICAILSHLRLRFFFIQRIFLTKF